MARSRSTRGFVSRVDAECQRQVERIGFTHVAGRRFVWDPSVPLLGWLGLNRAIEADGSVTVTPFVGIHALELEQFVAARRGERSRKGAFATFAFPLTMLPGAPRISASNAVFAFEPESGIEKRARKLASTVRRVALPFYRRMRSTSDVARVLRTVDTGGADAQCLTAALWLSGRKAAARRLSSSVVAQLPDMHPTMRDYLRTFFVSFRKYTEVG